LAAPKRSERSGRNNQFPRGFRPKLDPKNAITAIGGVRKRESGFDPVNGDWEYFYPEKSGRFSLGKLSHCSGRHQQTRKRDDVYRNGFAPQKD
jgi:hypothetical protein